MFKSKQEIERTGVRILSKYYREKIGPVGRELKSSKSKLVNEIWKYELLENPELKEKEEIEIIRDVGGMVLIDKAIDNIMDGADIGEELEKWAASAGEWYHKKPATRFKRAFMERMGEDISTHPVWRRLVSERVANCNKIRNEGYKYNALGSMEFGNQENNRITVDYQKYCDVRDRLDEENWVELAIKIIMLTGRRPNELFTMLRFEDGPVENIGFNRLSVHNVSKSAKGTVKQVINKHDAKYLNGLLRKLRSKVSFATPVEFDKSNESRKLQRTIKKLFEGVSERPITCKVLRGIYAAETWKEYKERWGLEVASRVGEVGIYPLALGNTTKSSYAYTRVDWV